MLCHLCEYVHDSEAQDTNSGPQCSIVSQVIQNSTGNLEIRKRSTTIQVNGFSFLFFDWIKQSDYKLLTGCTRNFRTFSLAGRKAIIYKMMNEMCNENGFIV